MIDTTLQSCIYYCFNSRIIQQSPMRGNLWDLVWWWYRKLWIPLTRSSLLSGNHGLIHLDNPRLLLTYSTITLPSFDIYITSMHWRSRMVFFVLIQFMNMKIILVKRKETAIWLWHDTANLIGYSYLLLSLMHNKWWWPIPHIWMVSHCQVDL